ncbi:hypothetical protein KSW81_004942 [Nannochloris sp. 'desiccata']|nr:hypothetical protein KSW81_004942 [Chlorella desiccata (nom. nud.)]
MCRLNFPGVLAICTGWTPEEEELSDEVHAASSTAGTRAQLLIVLAKQDAGTPEAKAAARAVREATKEAAFPFLKLEFHG